MASSLLTRRTELAKETGELPPMNSSLSKPLNLDGRKEWSIKLNFVSLRETLAEVPAEQAAGAAGENQNWAERVDESEEAKKEGEEGGDDEKAPNFITLDEYKQLKNQINKRNDFNIRRPGEGEDLSKWGKTYVLPKKADEEDEVEEEEEEEEEEEVEEDAEDEKKKNLIKTIQASFKFNELSSSSRGERRGPGGERGGRGAGGRGGERRDYGERRRTDRPAEAAEGEAPVAPAGEAAVAAVVESPQASGEEPASPADKPRRPFNSGGRGGQQRGGQRGGPGGRGGQQPRGGNPQKVYAAPKFDDEKDFPTLGK